jgi:hypothetical protein
MKLNAQMQWAKKPENAWNEGEIARLEMFHLLTA